MKLPEGKTRLDLVKEGMLNNAALPKRGRFIVSIHKLLEDPKNERRVFRNMDGLMASIKAHGIIEPITVTAEGESYRILTGHRRYRAAKSVGLTEIEVIARDPDDAVTRRRKSIISNVQREDIGAVEMAEALQALLDEDPGIKTQRQLAAALGKGEDWVSAMLRILSLPAKLQEKLGTSQVSISYDSAMRIARTEDAEFQKELVEATLRGETTRDIRSRIAEKKQSAAAPKREAGSGSKGSPASLQTVTLTESHEGYIATIRGPVGKMAKRHMRTVLNRLIKQL
jgi:ParB family transcriptional regulator, chromosome partitioning protein